MKEDSERNASADAALDSADMLRREPLSVPANAIEIPYRRYIPKRPHRKTRTGCKQCKKRRVKCDEARPVCKACVRRNEVCIYLNSPASALSSGAGLVLRSRDVYVKEPGDFGLTDDISVVAEPLFIPAQAADAFDMKMLWFYTNSTFESFSVNVGRSPIIDYGLKVKVVEHAFRSSFLMEALKALSALHLLSLNQPAPCRRIAAYQARALEGYRHAIQLARPDDYAALLTCALFMIAMSSHNFRDPRAKPLFIVDWIPIWRGIGLIAEIIPPGIIYGSGVYPALCRPPVDMEKTTQYIPNNLLFMVASIKEDEADHEYQDDYYELLKYLGSLYMELVEYGFNPVLDLRTTTFLGYWPRNLLPLAKDLRPRILIVIAHWLCFVKLLDRHAWWLAGLTSQADQIFSELGQEWDHLLRVPKAVMQTEDKVEIVGLIIHNLNWTPNELDLYHDRTRSDPGKINQEGIAYNGNEVGVTDGHWQSKENDVVPDVRDLDTMQSHTASHMIPCFPAPGSEVYKSTYIR